MSRHFSKQLIVAFILLFQVITAHSQFITTWKTDNPGESNNNQVKIPTFSRYSYNYSVDWGDGNSDTGVTGSITHTYNTPGTYTIAISGDYPYMTFDALEDAQKLMTIEQWGGIEWQDMTSSFYGCTNLTYNSTDQPDLSRVTSIAEMFRDAHQFNADISDWDVSNITDMSVIFLDATSFDQDLSNWDMSGVTDLSAAFDNSGMSRENYDNTLIGWSRQNLQSNVFLDASGVNFCAAEDARQKLIDDFSWNINGGNLSCDGTEILSFTFSNQATDTKIDYKNRTIDVTLKQGANLSAVAPSQIDLLSGASVSPAVGVNKDFSSSAITYTVTNGSDTEDWAVSVSRIPSEATDIIGFSFPEQASSAVIDGTTHTIEIDVLPGTNPNGLVPIIALSDGATISPMSGQSQDFSESFTYTVTAEDESTTEDWSVNVHVISQETDFISFEVDNQLFPAVIDAANHTVSISVLDRSNLADLNEIFELSLGATISPVSGSSQDFSSPVIYTITAEDGTTTQDWTVTITKDDTSFVTKWKTDNPGDSEDIEITIPTNLNFTYDFDVNWGDGTSSTNVTGDITHTYAETGTYTVSISGEFPSIYFNNQGDKEKFLNVLQWGNMNWESMENAFYGCSNLTYEALDDPDLSMVFRMDNMFRGASAFNGAIGSWDVSRVASMGWMFSEASSFNQPLDAWNVSNVRDMIAMFFFATSFDQDLNNWDVSEVRDMFGMFNNAPAFNGAIGNWDVSSCTQVAAMFGNASSFNQDISNWDISNVTNAAGMFNNATAFNQDINRWDVTNVGEMQSMFAGATAYDQSMEDWYIVSVSNMSNMFDNSGLSRPNYDTTVKGWADLNVQPNVTVGTQGLSYCTSESERQRLINNKNWIFSGDTNVCGTEAEITSFMLPGQIGSPFIDSDNATVTISVLGGTDLSSVVPDVQISEFGLLTPSADQAQNFSIDRSYRVNSEDRNAIKDWTIKTNVLEQTNFITTWDTRKTGSSNNDQITIPVNPLLVYDYQVDWGDGNTDTNMTGSTTHTYASEGEYVVSISGTFPAIYFNDSGDKQKLLSIAHWGDNAWMSMANAFEGCSNLAYSATDMPDLSNVTDMTRMFRNCTVFNGDIGNWDVSTVQLMASTFSGAQAFNQDIGGWNVGNVTTMESLFHSCSAFNQDLSLWDVSKVTSMAVMFASCHSFNQEIGDWNVGNVVNMNGMFSGAVAFNHDISQWDVSKVAIMTSMFGDADAFNQNLNSWDVSSVVLMNQMFFGAVNFNQSVSQWNVSNVIDMSNMFTQAFKFDQNLSSWNVEKVTNMDRIFELSGLSGQNYDLILKGWSGQNLSSNVTLGATGVTYCAAATERQSMIDTYGWNIVDDGLSCNDETDILSFLVYDQDFENDPARAADIDLINHTASLKVVNGIDLTSVFGEVKLSMGATSNIIDGSRQDLSAPIVITVTAEDGTTTQDWTLSATNLGGSTTPFITTWKTDNAGDSNDDQITIPTTGTGYDYTVDWGDGSSDNNVTGDITHTYATAGTYTVSITGDFPRIYFNNAGDKSKLLTVEQWGDNPWSSFENAFRGCENFDLNTTDVPDLSNVKSMRYAFGGAKTFNGNVTQWDVSNIIDMSGLFSGATIFDQPIGGWDVSNVTDMGNMFSGGIDFNQNINAWDVSNVTDMQWMFANSTAFNQPVDDWDVSSVTNMQAMFALSQVFNQDLSSWDVSSVTDMSFMFQWSGAFQGDISTWDVSSVRSFVSTFNGISYNPDVTNWDVGKVETFWSMFRDNSTFNQDISGWNTSSATSMSQFFLNATAFNQDISSWDVSSVTDMSSMFNGASAFNQDISGWNTSKVTDMSQMFNNASAFNQDIANWDVSNVTNMQAMLQHVSLFNFNLKSWDVTKVTNMSSMLSNSGLSKNNYDATLTGWAAQNLQHNVSLGASGLLYCTTFTGRQKLIDDFNWSIVGDVVNCEIGTDILSVSLPVLVADPIIDVANHTVTLEVAAGTDLTTLAPLIELGDNAGISPAIGVSTDFSSPVTYTVTAEDGTTIQEWIITVNLNQTYFTTTWKTDNAGVTDGDRIRIPTQINSSYQYKIYWGDGRFDENVTGFIEHTYATPGTYTVSITGDFPAISFDFRGDKEKLIAIEQWGDISWRSMSSAFAGCSQMEHRATDQPDLSNVTSMTSMFQDAVLFNGAIDDWDVSNVTNMGNLFNGATSFNQDLNSWDVSNLLDMSSMFSGATSFNGDISAWDVSKVRFMYAMFIGATAFNQDIGSWSVGNVWDMGYMFTNASAFNQDIGNWDVSKVTNMEFMFNNASDFDQPIDSWNVGAVTNMRWMFNKAKAFNQPVGSWDVSKVTKMDDMFSETDVFNQDISAWDVSSVTTIDWMFWQAKMFDQPVGDWDVSSLTTLVGTFNESPFNQDISSWDVSGVTDMRLTFANNDFFNQDLSAWDVSKVTNMFGTFSRATAFNQDISAWDVSSVTNMLRMFDRATVFNQDLSAWQIAAVTNVNELFDDSGLSNENYDLILTGWSTQNLQNGLTFGAANVNYCAATAERQSIIDSINWTITDGGQSCDGTEILTFEFAEQTGAATIDASAATVSVELMSGTDLITVTPSAVTVSYGATISPEPSTAQDFSNPITYTVNSADGSSKDWVVTVTEAPSTATDITSFVLAEETGSATINATDHTVTIEVANGTDLSSLTPTIALSDGANIEAASEVTQDFSSSVAYTVTAEDGTTTQTWTVTVTEAPSTATDITSFVLSEETGSATINATDHTIAIEVANGTDLSSLTPTIALSEGASIEAASGVSQDFSTSVAYTVTAEDRTTTQTWAVTVTEAPSTATDITSFVLAEETGAAMINATDHTIAIEAANGTDLSSLTPTIALSDGASIEAASGVTQDFSTSVAYTVTAEDGTTTQTWTVTVTEAPSTATDITSFVLAEETSSGTINTSDHTITIEVDNGTDLSALSPTISVSSGASITEASGVVQDFSSSVAYTVTAEDGTTTQIWTVTVTEASSTATEITSFVLAEETGSATINTTDHTITVEVANGTDLTTLTPAIGVSSGASITEASGVVQDFSSPVEYTVTAEDGATTQIWTVTVTEAPSTATDVISFVLAEETGSATINTTDHTITVEVANGTDLTTLTPTIGVSSGASITEASGVVQDFSSPVEYTVTAEDGAITQTWTVTVTEAPSTATDIISFVLAEETGSATINTTDYTINVEVVNGTDLTALTPTIGVSSGASISQASGVVQDFSSSVDYTVTAEDGTTIQVWTVTVKEAPSLATDITSFVMAEQTGEASINTEGHTVNIEVASGTDVKVLTPIIGLSEGASISPASDATQDFSNAVTYTVTAEDGNTTQVWVVTVTVAPDSRSSASDIVAFVLTEQTGAATIDVGAHSVNIEVAYGTDLTTLTPTIEVSAGASISPASEMLQDFSTVVTYTVTAENETTQEWTVTVTEAPSTDTDILAFTLLEQSGPAVINETDHTISIEVVIETDLSSLTPTIAISDGATISPAATQVQDFSAAVTYTVTAEDGMTSQDWVVTVTEEEALSASTNATVQVYPNPVIKELTVDFSEQSARSELTIVDSSGRQILRATQERQGKLILNVSDLMPGMYFLKVQEGEDLSTYRFIKE
ncbi:MAG: BspA family leucine-rich repeat surface protein [Cytophagales bacterium]|nr:BspA family leucine-rich repeat surface protein [Cytophagales bacterium]